MIADFHTIYEFMALKSNRRSSAQSADEPLSPRFVDGAVVVFVALDGGKTLEESAEIFEAANEEPDGGNGAGAADGNNVEVPPICLLGVRPLMEKLPSVDNDESGEKKDASAEIQRVNDFITASKIGDECEGAPVGGGRGAVVGTFGREGLIFPRWRRRSMSICGLGVI